MISIRMPTFRNISNPLIRSRRPGATNSAAMRSKLGRDPLLLLSARTAGHGCRSESLIRDHAWKSYRANSRTPVHREVIFHICGASFHAYEDKAAYENPFSRSWRAKANRDG